ASSCPRHGTARSKSAARIPTSSRTPRSSSRWTTAVRSPATSAALRVSALSALMSPLMAGWRIGYRDGPLPRPLLRKRERGRYHARSPERHAHCVLIDSEAGGGIGGGIAVQWVIGAATVDE